MNYKFVLESFDEYVKENYISINERDEDPGKDMSETVALEILEKIHKYNLDLLENYINKKVDVGKNPMKKERLPACLNLLKKGEGGKAVLKSFLKNFTKEDVFKEVVKKIYNVEISEDELEKSSSRKKLIDEISEEVDNMSREDADKKAELLLKHRNVIDMDKPIDEPIKRPAFWLLFPDADKNKLAVEFSKLAMKRGYNSEGPLLKVVENEFKDRKKEDRYYMLSPGFRIDTEAEAIESSSETPPKQYESFMISLANESEVFKPNATGSNGESDFQGDAKKEMLDNIGSILQRLMAGEITSLKKINIRTSADRYRNTGDAESLSWGQLSHARALTMAGVIWGMAEAVGLHEDLVSEIPKLINIYSKGENGDGTSGPNPPEGRFGYYVKDGNGVKFVDGEDRKTVTMIAVDAEGTPTADSADGAKTKSMDPEANKDDYNQYRYNNIEIIFDKVDTDPDLKSQSEESVSNLIFPARVSIPPRYGRIGISISIPSIGKSKSQSSGNKDKSNCPIFKSKKIPSYNFTFTKVKIVSWETDLGKRKKGK